MKIGRLVDEHDRDITVSEDGGAVTVSNGENSVVFDDQRSWRAFLRGLRAAVAADDPSGETTRWYYEEHRSVFVIDEEVFLIERYHRTSQPTGPDPRRSRIMMPLWCVDVLHDYAQAQLSALDADGPAISLGQQLATPRTLAAA